jgi:hypothetical protein
MIDGLSLIGAGTDSCIVDSRGFPLTNNRTITMLDSCVVTGFYIRTSNNFDYGNGIRSESQSGLITLNKLSDSNSGIYLYGSRVEVYKNLCFDLRIGINVFNSNSIVRKNEIFTLTESLGEAIYISAFSNNYYPIIDSNYIETISEGIRKSIGSDPIIKNNTIILVALSASGIFLSSSDSASVYNNLIYAKERSANYGIRNNGITYLQLYNNYVSGYFDSFQNYVVTVGPYNTVKDNVVTKALSGVEAVSTQGLVFQYNDVWKNGRNYSSFTPDTTNLSVDPMIVNDDTTQGDLDFRLQMFSPLIDAGDPNILDKDSTRSDIGLYGGPYGESYAYIDLPPRTPVNLTAGVDSNIVTLRWNQNTEADFGYYKIFYDTTKNFQSDSTKLVSSQPDTFYYFVIPAGAESLYFKLTAVDNQGNESNPSEEVGVVITSVKDEWKPLNNYILYQNYPNPFNPSTKIGYKLKERGYVKLYVYDIKGELVSVLVNEVMEAGYYEVLFDASASHSGEVRNLASGVYIYQIFVKGENNIPVFSDIKKMVYVK